MQFRDFVRKAMGSEGKVRVLLYLFKDKAPASEREIARILGMSNVSVNKIMKDFYDINLVAPMRVGAAQAWYLNKESYAYINLNAGMHTLAQQLPLQALEDIIQKHLEDYPRVNKAVIFGSVTEGRETPNSDIDLFILIEREEARKPVLERLAKLAEDCLKLFGNQLSPLVMTEREANLPKNQKLMDSIRKGIQIIPVI